jgi:hypothetical protein
MNSRDLQRGGRSQDRTADSYRVKVIPNQTKLSDSKGLFGTLGATASVRRSLKISAVALLAGLLAAPASAQAPVLTPAQQQLCYAWLALPAKQVAVRVYRDFKQAVPAKARPWLLRCLAGVVEAAQPEARNVCVAGFAADAFISSRLEVGLDICIDQALKGAPGDVIPEAFATSAVSQ